MDSIDAFIGTEIPVDRSASMDERRDNSTNERLAVFDLDALETDQNQPRLEMMEIHISLYTVSGISYELKSSSAKRKRRHGWRRKGKGAGAVSVAGGGDPPTPAGACSATRDTRGGGTTLSTISESCALPALSGFEMNPLLAPTTAVVSSTRNDPSSNTPMETFCPSLPLHRLSRGDPHRIRYNARWHMDAPVMGEDSNPSFKILRMMNQQQFLPTTSVADVSTYEHEQVELCVFVGRGREMIPIGVVSFVVTGDEETETILNLPIKPPVVGSVLHKRHFQPAHSKRKKGPKDFFDSDPNHCFKLGRNAILRIGVRAFPQRNFVEARKRFVENRRKEEKIFESVLQNVIDAQLLDKLEEERSMIDYIMDTHGNGGDNDDGGGGGGNAGDDDYHGKDKEKPQSIQVDEVQRHSSLLDQDETEDVPECDEAPPLAVMDTTHLIWKKFHEVLQVNDMGFQSAPTAPSGTSAPPSEGQDPRENPHDSVGILAATAMKNPMAVLQPNNLFCNFSFFPNAPGVHNTAGTTKVSADPPQVVTVNHAKNRLYDVDNHTLNLTLVSSVSESLGTEGGHSNSKFRSEF
jgi:hypothetical protein